MKLLDQKQNECNIEKYELSTHSNFVKIKRVGTSLINQLKIFKIEKWNDINL